MDQIKRKVKFPCNHPLSYLLLEYISLDKETYKIQTHHCDGCREVSGAGYFCSSCQFGAHVECIDFPDVINQHKDCIDLPRVININRHDHHIFRTYHLGHGDWECGVCRKKMDWTFGAFSCKRCPNYAIHSKCATREDVWDGEELEDVIEEEEEIEDPYKWINENEIIHFSHELI